MTPDPLTEIAEEMGNETFSLCPVEGTMILDWAARIRAYWTPERRAFMEAGEAWGKSSMAFTEEMGRRQEQGLVLHNLRIEDAMASANQNLHNAYRAMTEADNIEATKKDFSEIRKRRIEAGKK